MELSGKTVAAAIFGMVVLTFGIVHVISQYWHEDAPPAVPLAEIERTDIDTDGDGLKDWEEALIGTSPNESDSNWDGVTDYEEVARIRAALTTPSATSTDASGAPLTKTDTLTRDLFGAYASAKRMGTYNASAFSNVVEAAAREPFADMPKDYTASDITLIAQPTTEDKASYARKVRTTLSGTNALGEYELTIFARAVAHGNDTDYTALAHARDVYAAIADTLKETPVPSDAASTHVAMLNGFSRFSFALEKMSASRTDPALAFPAINAFLESEDMLKAAFTSFSLYLSLNNAA